MNPLYQRILNHIKGRSSQNPMGLNELRSMLGTTEAPLLETLDAMYGMKLISRAYITKMVNEKLTPMLYVWPTGILKPFNLATYFKISQPRRDEIKTVNTATKTLNDVTPQEWDKAAKKEPAMQADTDKTTTQIILEYIRDNPNKQPREIVKELNLNGFGSYINCYVARGVLIEHKSINSSGKKIKTYTIKDGVDISHVLYRKNYKRPSKAETLASVPAAKTTDAFAVADSIDEKLGDFAQTMQQIASEQDNEKQPANVIQLTLPQRHDAMFCIKTLLDIIPDGYELTICKREKTLIEIAGGKLDDIYTVKLENINESITALNTLSNLMHA